MSADTELLRELVRARTGIAVPDSRLPALQGAAGSAGLLRDAAELDTVLSGLNLGETYFFRDAGQMAALEQDILPALIAARRPHRRLRLWSAGCSSGEEPYTLAILLHRLIPDLPRWDATVLGTDVNTRSLDRARAGTYRPWSLRGTPPSAYLPHLVPVAGEDLVQVSPALRRLVHFARLNLATDPYPRDIDLVLCRNVLLYFDDTAARSVVTHLRDALHPGGWLMLGPVEAALGAVNGLQAGPHPGLYQRDPGLPIASEARPRPVDGAAAQPLPHPHPQSLASGAKPKPSAARPRPLGGAAAQPAHHPHPQSLTSGARDGHDAAYRLWQAGDAAGALELLERSAEQRPLDAAVHLLHGLVLLDTRRVSEALAAFRRCTYAEPGSALGHLGQAAALARVGRKDRARAAVERAAQLVGDPDPALPTGGPVPAELHELIAAHRDLLGSQP